MSFLKWLIEYFGVIGLVIFLARVAVSQLVLGAILSILGALLPSSNEHPSPSRGTVTVESGDVRFDFRGSAKLALVLCGFLVLAGATLEHYAQYASEAALRQVALSGSELRTLLRQQSQRCVEARKHANTSATPELDVANACKM
jgi:hypothetical protein